MLAIVRDPACQCGSAQTLVVEAHIIQMIRCASDERIGIGCTDAAVLRLRSRPQEHQKEQAMQTKTYVSEPETNGHGAGSTPPAVATAAAAQPRAAGEFHNFLADIEDLITTMTSLTGEDLARAKAKLSERVATAKKSVEEMGGEIAHQARRSATVTNNYVHENPWQAIGIGAAVGLLLGFILARRD